MRRPAATCCPCRHERGVIRQRAHRSGGRGAGREGQRDERREAEDGKTRVRCARAWRSSQPVSHLRGAARGDDARRAVGVGDLRLRRRHAVRARGAAAGRDRQDLSAANGQDLSATFRTANQEVMSSCKRPLSKLARFTSSDFGDAVAALNLLNLTPAPGRRRRRAHARAHAVTHTHTHTLHRASRSVEASLAL